MSSVRAVMVTGSALVFLTTTVKVNVPPGAGRVSGLAVLTTAMVGTTLVMRTMASSVSVTWVPAGLGAHHGDDVGLRALRPGR